MSFPAYASTATQLPLPTPPNPTSKPHLPPSLNKPHLPLHTNPDESFHQTVSWTSSIARYSRNGLLSKAAAEFSRMRLAGVQPNDVTFVTLLSGCAHFPSNSLQFGASLHGYISKLGFDPNNVMIYTALVDMYSKCARVGHARVVFDRMPVKNSMSWNTMIDGYMRSGEFGEAVELFDQMPVRDKNKISWTALVSGFVKMGLFVEALECFREMQLSGVEPDHVTVVALLSACANLGMLGLGIWFHRYAMQCGLSGNIRVKNSLVDMYARCGCVEFARQEFRSMNNRSLVSWNSMIVGLAINGYAEEALQHFFAMQREGFKPNGVTLTGALTACSHGGLIEEGIELYNTMTKCYKIFPRIEHYGCIVDLLSRAGRLEDAFSIIESMPMEPNEVVLGSLLAACSTQGNISLGERLSRYLVDSRPGSDSNYISLSNLYAAAGRWGGVGKVRRTMKAQGITKTPGYSAIEIECNIHEFMAGDESHTHSKHIYAVLDELSLELRLHGYVDKTKVEYLSEYG